MSRTLVWMTHSFRMDSRLTTGLSGECTFAYYSPYHFAGAREREIYKQCSQENLDAFYFSINSFARTLKAMNKAKLHVFRVADPIAHINKLIEDHGYTMVVIDQPLFAMWHSIDLSKINCTVKIVDSDLVDDKCIKMTAKSRWTSHIQGLKAHVPHQLSSTIIPFNIPGFISDLYPNAEAHPLVDRTKVFQNILKVIKSYHETRDRHDGQTNMSVALHNGIIDPTNIFYAIAGEFDDHSLTSPASAILRQQAFREISIIQARRAKMTLENTPLEWAKALMHYAAFDNMMNAKPDPKSRMNKERIVSCHTGYKDLDFLLSKLKEKGIMPNRARMFFASHMFYSSPTGLTALENTIATFDLLGLDGQSPNNYTQCIGALGLSYGKVLKMNRDAAFTKLAY